MIWKTLLIAEKTFRRLDAPELLADVASGVVYVNGVRAVNRRDDKVGAPGTLGSDTTDRAPMAEPLPRR